MSRHQTLHDLTEQLLSHTRSLGSCCSRESLSSDAEEKDFSVHEDVIQEAIGLFRESKQSSHARSLRSRHGAPSARPPEETLGR
jgi:hypothetical protein